MTSMMTIATIEYRMNLILLIFCSASFNKCIAVSIILLYRKNMLYRKYYRMNVDIINNVMER